MNKIYWLLIVCVLCLVGCGKTTYTNHEPDDIISEAICAAINNGDIFYQGQHISSK